MANRPPPALVALRLFLIRLVYLLGTLVGAVCLILTLLWAAPGDAIDVLPEGEALRPVLAAEWQLTGTLPERLGRSLAAISRGDLGSSHTLRPGAPVTELLAKPARRSVGWVLGALGLALVWGAALAAWTHGRRGTTRRLVQLFSVPPIFLLAHLSVGGLNAAAWWLMQHGWLSRPGWFALPDHDSLLRTSLAVVLLAAGSGSLADVHREVEQAWSNLHRSGFVIAARARGAPLWPHLLPHLALSLASVAAARVGLMVGALVILERVLLLNGVGALLWQAALQRDLPVAIGVTLFTAALVTGVRLAADAARIALDPRLRAEAHL